MSKEGGTPWQVWAVVTLLGAVITSFGKELFVKRPSADTDAGRPLVGISTPTLGGQTLQPIARSDIDWSVRLGSYDGESINRTTRNGGYTLFDLKAVEPSRRVRASVEWSRGLFGSGTLVGTAANDTLDLSGTILSDRTGNWESEVRLVFVSADSIQGTYRLFPQAGNGNGTQEGNFVLKRIR